MTQASLNAPASFGRFILYTAPDGAVKVEVFFRNETVWLTQKALAELFGVKRPAVTKHLLNIFKTGELVEDAVNSILEHTAADGKKYATTYYNLDAIIAVGYRVNSYQAAQFRIWATQTLREYIIKSDNMEACAPRKDFKVGRRRSEELPERGPCKGVEPARIGLSRPRREPCAARHCDENG